MRRLLTALVVTGSLLLSAAGTAHASVEYCDWDPPVSIITPGGNLVVVYVDARTSSLSRVGEGSFNYAVKRGWDRDGTPYTDVTINFYVPNAITGPFPLQDVVSTGLNGSGTWYTAVNATSGQWVPLQFRLAAA